MKLGMAAVPRPAAVPRLRATACLVAAAGLVAGACMVLLPGRALAQQAADTTASRAPAAREGLLPAVRPFRWPAADPLAPRMGVAMVSTDLLATQGPERPAFQLPNRSAAARELVAMVALGGVLPVALLQESPAGYAALVLEGRVFARFRVELRERDDMGQDWFVGGGVEVVRSRFSGRAMLMHRSSHLGDEFIEATGARRIEFGSEHVDLLGAWDVPGLARLYGGGSLIFRSYLGWNPTLRQLVSHDRAILQLGADREWRPFDDGRVAVVAGADWQAAERTGWRRGLAGTAGMAVHARESGRWLKVLLRYYDGPSLMGEFFLTPERLYGLELHMVF
jgi:hypothetical protein